jgi:2,4-dienoyl-CoA reductase-like NADH-dependent reductase (Old Yellow Enzyme family)/pyruvate/2-oxoglutarate dehydrogenase complex dihydrolipoamide dehydrogenase (E3) component
VRYSRLFAPFDVGPVRVPNRFYFSPQGNPAVVLAAAGKPTEDFAAYYEERAAGGVGMVLHSLNTVPRVQAGRHCPYYEDTVPAFAALAARMHRHDTKIFGQLNVSKSQGKWDGLSAPAPLLGASATSAFWSQGVARSLRAGDIAALVNIFRQCARNLARAGYDGIEIHATHGMLVEQFLSPYFNRRSDEYGGTVENRMRFLVEILGAVREEIGSSMALGLRFNCDEFVTPGLDHVSAGDILRRLDDAGLIDFVDLDIALEPDQLELGMPSYFLPPLFYKQYAAKVRNAIPGVPVLCALVRVTDLADAEEALADGTVDLVGAARPLIAEPRLLENAREGREDESRTCIGANLCLSMSMTSHTWSCAINPSTGRERLWSDARWAPAPTPGKVVVVGGGPAGLEAARVAAHRGHEVVLFERRATLGGQYALWASLPDREPLLPAIDWWARQLEQLGVRVRAGTEATVEMVAAEGPDAIIVATGAGYARSGETGFRPQPIAGADQDHVVSAEQVIEGGSRPGGKVIVLEDEGLNGAVGAAELLAAAGADVEIVTRWAQIAKNLDMSLELPFVIRRLKALGVTLTAHTYIREIHADAVTVYDTWTGEDRRIEGVQAVVMAGMRQPEDALLDRLEGTAAVVLGAGDVLGPRTLTEATYEGHRFARMLGEPDAPRDFTAAYWTQPDPSAWRSSPAEMPSGAEVLAPQP